LILRATALVAVKKYGAVNIIQQSDIIGGPGRTRTCNQTVMSAQTFRKTRVQPLILAAYRTIPFTLVYGVSGEFPVGAGSDEGRTPAARHAASNRCALRGVLVCRRHGLLCQWPAIAGWRHLHEPQLPIGVSAAAFNALVSNNLATWAKLAG
jgi:hypothetical protein